MEQFKQEEKQIEEDINNVLKDIMNDPKSLVAAIISYDGQVLNSPNEKDVEPYSPYMAPFTKRCMLIARCLDPYAVPLGFTMWSIFATYTVVFDDDFFGFAKQIPLSMPYIPPKPIEEMSETERNERQDEEIKNILRLKQEQLRAKEEAAAKLELEKKERIKRKRHETAEEQKETSSEEDLTSDESESSESSEMEDETADESKMAE